uniref:Uncharacterized protein n=1 Tax=Helianthus annuus TaxID=4232 RepID=A0A251SVN1_HELAN
MVRDTIFVVRLAVAGVASAGTYGIQVWSAFKARPVTPVVHNFFHGSFQPQKKEERI